MHIFLATKIGIFLSRLRFLFSFSLKADPGGKKKIPFLNFFPHFIIPTEGKKIKGKIRLFSKSTEEKIPFILGFPLLPIFSFQLRDLGNFRIFSPFVSDVYSQFFFHLNTPKIQEGKGGERTKGKIGGKGKKGKKEIFL